MAACLAACCCKLFSPCPSSPPLVSAVREAARGKDTIAVLKACDHLRDALLPPLGVVLEDAGATGKPAAAAAAAPAAAAAATGGDGTGSDAAAAAAAGAAKPAAAWKLRDPEELKREAEEKKRAAEEKQRAKEAQAAARRKAEEDKILKASVPPGDFYRGQTDKYSAFDAAGVPTHDAEGKEIEPKKRDKLGKALAEQAKAHEWFKALPADKTAFMAAAAAAGSAAAAAAAPAAATATA